MTKIIAFSGNSNTGKSTAIRYLNSHFGSKHPDKRLEIYEETARTYIDAHGGKIDDVRDFECWIINQEATRLEELQEIKKNNRRDLIFIDRTTLDPVIYSYRNLVNGNISNIDYLQDYFPLLTLSKQLYDHVVFFTTPIKVDTRFPIYNNEHINKVFEHTVRWRYDDKVIIYTNNIFFQDNIEATIFADIFSI